MLRKIFCVLMTVSSLIVHTQAQQHGMNPLSLNDLSAFKSQSGNWSIVGDVVMNPSIDINHDAKEPDAPVTTKKKKSKEKPPEITPAVTFSSGKGILLNMNDNVKKDHLVTLMEHGDIELELEVMLPKGSNSGIYLQGRYEVQLLDSWGKTKASYSDIGGIYRNWETDPSKIYMGKAPLSNASKAPGLWQKLKISFQAPRFDSNNNKIANARFLSVVLNDVIIHSNIEVPTYTGGAIENNETPSGPIMIQGDHGPVAFRNIHYRLMKDMDFKISEVAYEIYHGNFGATADLASLKPVISGKSELLSSEVIDVNNAYGVRYTGKITVPEDATYTFTAGYTGGAKLSINGKELFNLGTRDSWRRDTGSIELKAGTYPFEILNFKDASWMPPRLSLSVQASNTYPKDLHAINSFPPNDNPVSAIYINPGKEPRLIRAFVDYNGKQSERLTHTIGVGDPAGVHYVYDIKSGNLVCVWRGEFVDATPMWHERGDGSFKPRGAVLFLFNNQPFSYLNTESEAFPSAAKEGDLKSNGYNIAETNRPIFNYTYQGLVIEDRVYPDEQNTVITHEVIIKTGTPKSGLYYKLAEGSAIQQISDGSYAINDKQYYIKPGPGLKPFIRDVNGKKELVTPFNTSSLKYSIIW